MLVSVHQRQALRSYLQRDPGRFLYELGDLEPFFWKHTLWFGWEEAHSLQALVLVYLGDAVPVLLAMGQSSPAMTQLLKALPSRLPGTLYAHVLAEHRPLLKTLWQLQGAERYQRMVLGPSQRYAPQQHSARLSLPYVLRPIPSEGPSESDPGKMQDRENGRVAKLLERFYQRHYPDNWFNPRMLATDAYMAALKRDLPWSELALDDLVAVAGVHVKSQRESVAALGNIAVAREARGQGLGTVITAAVSQRLMAQGVQSLGLNVHTDNQPAIRAYARLGYVKHHEYVECTLKAR